jgi:hypothetical protein
MRWFSGSRGVSIDKLVKPPILYGMGEIPINSPASILRVFDAIAIRNTAGTGLNDSSSRSHCFVFLTLYTYDPAAESLRVNRFQFADLAGSERIQEAHGENSLSTTAHYYSEGLLSSVFVILLSYTNCTSRVYII